MDGQLDLLRSGEQPPVTHGRRGAARARLALPARAVSFNGTTRCMILDASRTGAQIACEELPSIGAMIVIELPPIEFFGTVAWVCDGRFGLHFDEPLSHELVVDLRRRADIFDGTEEARAIRRAAKEFVEGRI